MKSKKSNAFQKLSLIDLKSIKGGGSQESFEIHQKGLKDASTKSGFWVQQTLNYGLIAKLP